MILIADGGSTKVDWIAINKNKQEEFRITTLSLNPSIIEKEELLSRIVNIFKLTNIKEKITEIHFYGAGCGTPEPIKLLKKVLKSIFIKAKIFIKEDILAAVYATSGKKPAMVCILGTGSNSCYFDGIEMQILVPSLGYVLMDEASGNYFGKKLIADYYYARMPKTIASIFKEKYNLEVESVKQNIYKEPNPNMYLASFAKFMFDYKNEKYIKKLIKKGFQEFFKCRVLPYNINSTTPIYFIGSIAYYFREILEKVADKNNLKITNIIQNPIDNLLEYHIKNINL